MDVIITSIITFFGTIFGTIIGAVITAKVIWKTSKRESEDKFKLAALDKRLDAYQEAYGILINLQNELIFENLPEGLHDSFSEITKLIKKSFLLLDSKSRDALINVYSTLPNSFDISKFSNIEEQKKSKEELEKLCLKQLLP